MYLLLRDTYGMGLIEFNCHGLRTHSAEELQGAKDEALRELLEEEGYSLSEEEEYLADLFDDFDCTWEEAKQFLYDQIVCLVVMEEE